MQTHLGCKNVIIVPPLAGEATGHVDMFMTIPGPGEAIVGQYSEAYDPINAARLERVSGQLLGAGFRVRRVPMPEHRDDIVRTYTNIVLVNDVVLVPVYPEANESEKRALAVFQQVFPARRIIPIVASELIELDGALHCITMTIAAAR